MYKQWASPDGETFYPVDEVIKNLPPGYYEMEQTMSSVCFTKRKIKNENLLVFPDSSHGPILEEIDRFWKLEPKFLESKIPFKRGILMYGPPGSGKTCSIRMVIDNLVEKHSGIVIDFQNTRLFEDGYKVLRQIHADMPLVVLMEDLDAIINRCDESKLLNMLDGMLGIHKVIFLATTNYPERLGSRIMNRPSRFDRRVFVGMPSAIARETYIRSKLIGEDDNVIKRWVEDTNGLSIAHIKELYVANKILGDSYDIALKTLKGMKCKLDSSTFDDYGTVSEEPVQGRLSEDKYAKFGTGEIYKMLRGTSNPDGIANLISEDIRHGNGLI
jgi:AAA+ superfamily predicted ATPase